MKNTILHQKNYKKLIFSFLFAFNFLACKSKNEVLISEKYVDSLLNINTLSKNEKFILNDLAFWKKRYDGDTTNSVNAQKYASMLLAKFHLYGDIKDLKSGEKIVLSQNEISKGKESGLNRILANYASLQHRFLESKGLSMNALSIGDNRYESLLHIFDASFESGEILQAKAILHKIYKKYEYAYFFRLAKMQHYDGELEKAIESMKTASELANGNINLQQAALSNMADLQLHAGDYENAKLNYSKSLALDFADFHSLKGLGLIAQNHDKNYKLAEKIYKYLTEKTKSPDILFNLCLLAQAADNKPLERKYAIEFVHKASQTIYGNMYNKYLIELNDGILQNPKMMLEIAQKEIKNRNTPQTNSWYAWALYRNNKKYEAMNIYKSKIAEKPLEGLELFFMGKMMKAEAKNYNANGYFEAANKNRFELSPAKQIELNNLLKS